MQKTDELYNKAANAFNAGDYEGAKSWANKCLAVDKKEFRSLNLLGVILAMEGKSEAAANAYQKSLEANPRNPQTINNLANLLSKDGELQKAASLYQNAIVLDPGFLTARQNLAKTSLKLGNLDEAISEAAKCFELDSTDGSSLITLGNALRQKKEYEAALEAYTIALGYPKSQKDALIELGLLKSEQKLHDEALGYFVKVLQLDPNHAASYCNVSSILIDKGQISQAKGAIIKAFELDPNDAVNHINLGVLLKWEGKREEAKNAFAKAIELGDPKNAAKTNLGLMLMAEGDYENGFVLYDYRPKTGLICDAPVYGGEELEGKTLLVYHEQGFGDTINFARLLKHKKLSGAKIIFSPQEPLLSLFKASTLGVSVMSQDEITAQNPHFDYHTSLIDLLRTLQIRADAVPQNIDYIVADAKKAEQFASKLDTKKRKIGLVWSGNKQYLGDVLRSIDHKLFGALKNPSVQFVSLQKECEPLELETLKNELDILDFSVELEDFSDTAALISSLDMVISVDTSVAHLAATMGKPTWILLPLAADWRWGTGGETTPWYESVKLLRKGADEEWSDVLAKVANSLNDKY